MVLEFEFPDTGEGVTEGKFLEWLVEEGEEIDEDQILGEAETDKAVIDIPAPSDGVIKELKAEPGDNIKVGEVIMVMDTGQDTETDEEEPEENNSVDQDEEVEIDPEPKEEKQNQESSDDVLALPKVRKMAREKGISLSSIKTGERITEEDLINTSNGSKQTNNEEISDTVEEEKKPEEENSKPTIQDTSDVKATPSVRKLARENGVDLNKVEGSGRDGKVTREDVLNYNGSSEVTSEENEEVTNESPSENKKEERVKMSGIRKTTARRMKESKFSAPHVTHVEKADVTELVKLREREKEDLDVHLTYLPFIIKATRLAMDSYPELNAELDEENDEIILKKHYDFNIAVDTDKGLLVPIIEEVDEKNIVELAEEIGDTAGKAKHGDLSSEMMRNGTFSIIILGVIGGEEFTPIINYPQTAILGVGKIQETAEVIDGEVVPRTTVKLSLSYDHRVVDGATAARFVNELVENLENPSKMLIEM